MRAGFMLKLKPGGLDEYQRLHDEIWPELIEELARNGVRQVSIYAAGSSLFIYSEVDNEDSWETLWHTDVHLRWGAQLEPYLELDADGAPDSTDLREIFHVEPQLQT
jgi:L-rhamnose mutarotase